MENHVYKKLSAFPIPALQPRGWLRDQLQIQMDGLTGKLHEVWDSVGSYSGWLGGTGENWERAPYYLDGLLPLAHYLGDQPRWELACRFVEWTLNSRDSGGNFGPEATKSDYWSRFAMLKVLIQFWEITGDDRVIALCAGYLRFVRERVKVAPMTQWSKARVPDLMYCLKWLQEQQPREEWGEIMAVLQEQTLDWEDYLGDFPFSRPTGYYYNWGAVAKSDWGEADTLMQFHATHIVNVTMGLKYPAMLQCFDDDGRHYARMKKGMDSLKKYHGVVSGAINGDEHLSGNSPSQGAELCSIVEYMFSLQSMLEVFGDPELADLLERLAYNALPATITEDFMAHQYLQQANQVLCSDARRGWFNNGAASNLFGLEPNFGCCTANMHQGWPKFLKSLWFRQGGDTLVSMTFAPSEVRAEMGGKPLGVELQTDYPFTECLRYVVREGVQVAATLKIRVPQWCENPGLAVNGEAVPLCLREGFLVVVGTWNAGDTVVVTLPMTVQKSHWFRDSLALERGPLVLGLNIREKWTALREAGGVKDYEVSAESPWNYALAKDGIVSVEEKPVSAVPFSKEHPPVVARAPGRLCAGWAMEKNSAAPPPQSPVATGEKEELLELIPFGCTKLRIAQFPYYL